MRPFFGIRRGLLFLIIIMTVLIVNLGVAQTEWEKYPDNPVLDIGAPGTWDSVEMFCPSVIYDGSEYKMWYAGHSAIGFATSPDGVNWTKYPGNPVFTGGPSGAWDHGFVIGQTVLFNDGVYKMWYQSGVEIGYATSPDGINWTRYANSPVLEDGCFPCVLFDGTEYKMWYGQLSISYATSPDGINWTKHPDNPVLEAGGLNSTWDRERVSYPSVLFDGTIYEMWYGGMNAYYAPDMFGIGYATSPDGVNWTKHPDNPVLDKGEPGTFDGHYIYDAAVIYNGTSYEMWYSADNNGSYLSIGYAVSSPQEGASAAISVETIHKASKDESFPAAINVENISDLAGFQFDVAFDPTVLEAVTVEEGTFLSDSGGTYWLEPDIDNKAGIIAGTACAMTTSGGVDGTGTLATITFKAVSVGESDIKLQNIVLSNSTGGIIPAASTDASVIVVDYPLWDVNKDGVVNVVDMVLVGQHFGESITAPQYPNPDVNGDGVVNIQDIVLVGQHFGEVYSASAPSQDLWSVDPRYLPILAKIYAIMEAESSADPDFIATKNLIFRLMANAGIARTEVFQNYPNPFNPDTWIPYQLAEDSEVTVRIYDSAGRLIRTLDLGHRAVGLYITRDAAAYWDGKTDTGEYVSSGVFFYTIQAGEFTATRKMVVEK